MIIKYDRVYKQQKKEETKKKKNVLNVIPVFHLELEEYCYPLRSKKLGK